MRCTASTYKLSHLICPLHFITAALTFHLFPHHLSYKREVFRATETGRRCSRCVVLQPDSVSASGHLEVRARLVNQSIRVVAKYGTL